MAELIEIPILINEEYFKLYSLMPKNYNWQEIKPFVHTSEKIWVEPLLGIPLYEELLEQVNNNTVTPENSTLLLQLYPYLCNATIYESLPFFLYKFSEVGVTKGFADNATSISQHDLNFINTHIRAIVEATKKLLKKFLEEHSDVYPLYRPDGCDCDTSCICSDYDWIIQYYDGGYNNRDWFYYYSKSQMNKRMPNPHKQVYGLRRVNVDIK